MPFRSWPALTAACTRPMVSALVIAPPSHRSQNRAVETVSSALRLPKRAQNIARADFSTRVVGVRGWGRASVTLSSTSLERSRTFSAKRSRRRSTPSTSRPSLFPDAFPFQLGNLFEEALEFLVIAHRLSDAGFPWLVKAELSRLT